VQERKGAESRHVLRPKRTLRGGFEGRTPAPLVEQPAEHGRDVSSVVGEG
jgi:hypothetical protein